MSSVICSHYVIKEGCEPVMQITSRDRNRIMLQSDLYGAYALGVRNVLFIQGDLPSFGTHPDATAVYDLDSPGTVALANRLRSGYDMAGDELEGTPSFFVGATFDPNDLSEKQLVHLKRKIDAGARFFQTQAVFDVSALQEFMKRIVETRVKTIVGIIPLRTPEIAEFMDTKVPGITVPTEMIDRLKKAGEGLPEEKMLEAFEHEGIQMALELIEDIKRVPGVSGIHLMGVGWTESIPVLVQEADLHPRPSRG